MAFGFIKKPIRFIRKLRDGWRVYRTVSKAVNDLKKGGSMPVTGAVATVPVKSAWYSKINWTQVLSVVAAILAFFGVGVPEELKDAVAVAITAVTAAVTIILRTYFNKTVTPE